MNVDLRGRPTTLECQPVFKDVICRFGEKCFHNIHYLCTTRDTASGCIPGDACPFEALVTNLRIDSVERANGCVRICGRYDITVFFRFDGQRRIGQAERDNVDFCVQVPLSNVNDGCVEIVCEDGRKFETEVCAFNTRLEVVEATVEPDPDAENICHNCPTRLRVVVEKIFRAFEHGPQVLCIPVCPPEACAPPPPGTISPACPPFVKPTECPSFCVDDEVFFPDNCDVCPPPQTTVRPTRPCNS
ncbi:hypothetical protein [Zhaonella formicivorans]|uniref:hypothetical protein n=1 Tax=Zhaonella formicivorans TaxID=2528593 RepID=UPI0010EC3E35|nr:hypothetical protein [Zhaonella formicivorans]